MSKHTKKIFSKSTKHTTLRTGRSLLARYKKRVAGVPVRPKRLDQIKGSLVYATK